MTKSTRTRSVNVRSRLFIKRAIGICTLVFLLSCISYKSVFHAALKANYIYTFGDVPVASSGYDFGTTNLHILERLQMNQYEAASIMKSNSSEYTWLGNSFIGPRGVPTFTPKQIKAYFEGRDVLFLGDSTSRRLFNTINGIITAEDLDDVKISELDEEDVLNANKDGTQILCDAVQQNRSAAFIMHFNCNDRIVDGGDEDDAIPASTTSSSTMMPAGAGSSGTESDTKNDNTRIVKNMVKFDTATAYCYSNIEYFWRDYEDNDPDNDPNDDPNDDPEKRLNPQLKAINKDYDLVILSIGIWELSRPDSCERKEPKTSTVNSRMRRMMNNLQRNTRQDLQVAIRTSGFDTRQDNSKMFDSNAVTRDFFHNMTTHGNDNEIRANLTLVDWGKVISKRSFESEEIKSNDRNPAHYGLEARLLLVQQQMHELIKADLMKVS